MSTPALSLQNGSFGTERQVTETVFDPLLLRGFNIAAPAKGRSYWELAKSLGANFIRAPIAWSQVMPRAATFDEVVLANLDANIAWAGENGIYVLIDFHQFLWSERFPDPAGGSANGIPAWYYETFHPDYTKRGDAIAHFWVDPDALEQYSFFASRMVERFSAHENIVGYTILNELNSGRLSPGSTVAGQTFKSWNEITQLLHRWQAAVIANLLAVDAERPYFVFARGGSCLGLGASDFSVYPGNVGLEFHSYLRAVDETYSEDGERYTTDWDGTHNREHTDYHGTLANQEASHRFLWQKAAEGIPYIVGEWGVRKDDAGRMDYLDQMLAMFAEHRSSWAYWELGNGRYGVLTDGRVNDMGRRIAVELQA